MNIKYAEIKYRGTLYAACRGILRVKLSEYVAPGLYKKAATRYENAYAGASVWDRYLAHMLGAGKEAYDIDEFGRVAAPGRGVDRTRYDAHRAFINTLTPEELNQLRLYQSLRNDAGYKEVVDSEARKAKLREFHDIFGDNGHININMGDGSFSVLDNTGGDIDAQGNVGGNVPITTIAGASGGAAGGAGGGGAGGGGGSYAYSGDSIYRLPDGRCFIMEGGALREIPAEEADRMERASHEIDTTHPAGGAGGGAGGGGAGGGGAGGGGAGDGGALGGGAGGAGGSTTSGSTASGGRTAADMAADRDTFINTMSNNAERSRWSGLGTTLGVGLGTTLAAGGYYGGNKLADKFGWEEGNWRRNLARYGLGALGGVVGGLGGYYGGKALTHNRHMNEYRANAENAWDSTVAARSGGATP